MTDEIITGAINSVVYLLPIMGIVWKGAKLSARFEELEKKVNDNVGKFCHDHRDMQDEIDKERAFRIEESQELKEMLNKIQQSIVRIETQISMQGEIKK